MMAWLIGGTLMLAAILIGGKAFVEADPKKLASGLRTGAALALGALGAGLIVGGRFVWGGMLIAVAASIWPGSKFKLPFFGGSLNNLFGQVGAAAAGSSPKGSTTTETDHLVMELDLDSGDVSGQVKTGPYAGRTLASLALPELLDFRQQLVGDTGSLALVETYLDRRFGPGWRSSTAGANDNQSYDDKPMDDEAALDILGLEQGATEAEIKAAHRSLMKQMHPDQGGSTWLAAKINQARAHLLNE